MTKAFTATSILIGTIIGAGILGIPYVFMRSGLSIGLINLVIVGFLMIVSTLYLGEISLRTKVTHQLSGYAAKYLGKKGKKIMFAAFAFGIYAALLAYLIGEGESLSQLIFNSSAYSLHMGIAFWIVLSLLTYRGLKALEEGESLGVSLIFIMVIAITIFAWNKIDVSNFTYSNWENIFLPFGVVLFACLGVSAIPEIRRTIGNKGRLMKKTILTANLIVLTIYAIFAAVVLGYKGSATPPIATLALGKAFILLGMLTMFTSYLALSIALRDTLRFDFNKSKKKAWFYTIMPSLIIYIVLSVIEKTNFTKILGIGGVISGGLTAILILLMVDKAKMKGDRKPEYSMPHSQWFTYLLIILFILGAIAEIYYSF